MYLVVMAMFIFSQDSKGTEQILEDSSKIDVTPMKNLATPDCNPDAWFIVMDLEVLLNEFKFLNTLTDSGNSNVVNLVNFI